MSDEPISKTRRKKDAIALQEIGAKLCELRPDRLALVPLQPLTRESIDEFRRLTGHEARRRQLQRIGKLMRHENLSVIETAMQGLTQANADEQRLFRLTQRWRDRLLQDGEDGIAALQKSLPTLEISQIRILLSEHQQGREGAARTLFNELRRALSLLS